MVACKLVVTPWRKTVNLNVAVVFLAHSYWNIRGLAAPIRYILELMGATYTEKRYQNGDAASGYDRSEWLSVKETLGCVLLLVLESWLAAAYARKGLPPGPSL